MGTRRLRILTFLVCVIAAVVSVYPAIADYLGPNRTTTVTAWKRHRCRYQAVYDPAGPGYYSCLLTLYYSPTASCPATGSVAAFFNPSYCSGWPGSCTTLPCNITKTGDAVVNCNPGESGCTQVQETTTLPPATVSGSFSCSTPGNNGWCVGGGAINFTANEPVSGYNITYIERSSGVLCDPADAPSVSCSWSDGGEGNYSISFWAHSSYGDTSSQSSATWMQDTTPPSVSVSFSGGTAGGGGWYRGGPITAAPSASDATSGVALAQVRVGGGSWESSISITGDGTHTIEARAEDAAGNSATGSGSIRIDNSAPNVSISLSGQMGQNSWYVGPVTATVSASDGPSGIQSSQIRADSGGWTGGSVTVSGDGAHNFTAHASDVAGNESTATAFAKIDCSPPSLTYTIDGTLGLAGWYVSQATVHINASDSGSGLRTTLARVGGGEWQNTRTLELDDGVHAVNLEVSDFAGHQANADFTVMVDTQPPVLAIFDPALGRMVEAEVISDPVVASDSNEQTPHMLMGDPLFESNPVTPGLVAQVSDNFTFTGQVEDEVSGLSHLEISLDGGQTWEQLDSVGSGQWEHQWGSASLPEGIYTFTVRAVDVAGNTSEPVAVQVSLSRTQTVENSGTSEEEEQVVLILTESGTTILKRPSVEKVGFPWQLLALLGITTLAGVVTLIDQRPPAWSRLATYRQQRIERSL